jgi:hypothetical protein
MDFAPSPQQDSIRDAILKICARFDDAYWLERDRDGGFPTSFTMRWHRRAGSASASRRNSAARV